MAISSHSPSRFPRALPLGGAALTSRAVKAPYFERRVPLTPHRPRPTTAGPSGSRSPSLPSPQTPTPPAPPSPAAGPPQTADPAPGATTNVAQAEASAAAVAAAVAAAAAAAAATTSGSAASTSPSPPRALSADRGNRRGRPASACPYSAARPATPLPFRVAEPLLRQQSVALPTPLPPDGLRRRILIDPLDPSPPPQLMLPDPARSTVRARVRAAAAASASSALFFPAPRGVRPWVAPVPPPLLLPQPPDYAIPDALPPAPEQFAMDAARDAARAQLTAATAATAAGARAGGVAALLPPSPSGGEGASDLSERSEGVLEGDDEDVSDDGSSGNEGSSDESLMVPPPVNKGGAGGPLLPAAAALPFAYLRGASRLSGEAPEFSPLFPPYPAATSATPTLPLVFNYLRCPACNRDARPNVKVYLLAAFILSHNVIVPLLCQMRPPDRAWVAPVAAATNWNKWMQLVREDIARDKSRILVILELGGRSPKVKNANNGLLKDLGPAQCTLVRIGPGVPAKDSQGTEGLIQVRSLVSAALRIIDAHVSSMAAEKGVAF